MSSGPSKSRVNCRQKTVKKGVTVKMLADGSFATRFAWAISAYPQRAAMIMVHRWGRIVQFCVMCGVKHCRVERQLFGITSLCFRDHLSEGDLSATKALGRSLRLSISFSSASSAAGLLGGPTAAALRWAVLLGPAAVLLLLAATSARRFETQAALAKRPVALLALHPPA
jgi:hypothetical protein